MLRPLYFKMILFILLANAGSCTEEGFIFDGNGSQPLENFTISEVKPSDIISFTTSAGTDGIGTTWQSKKTVSELQKIFDQRIQAENPVVHERATELALKHPGDHTIEQVNSIHNFLTSSWNYTGDPRGSDYYKYANETLALGENNNCAGAGDCDDFALLMSAMVESIGGTTRIMMAKGTKIGHAYAEVYLGNINLEDNNVNRIINWLKNKYEGKPIHVHTDMGTGDVWLNLDWGRDKFKASYPGGPFYEADQHIPIFIKDTINKEPLQPSPIAIFENPSKVNAGEPVNFDASQSDDYDDIKQYDWNFGDDGIGEGRRVNHTYAEGGNTYKVMLTVTDRQGITADVTSQISVNSLPVASFIYSPKNPQVGDEVVFKATPSNDSDGRIVAYYWDFNQEDFSVKDTKKIVIDKEGDFWVNLTVTDDFGAKGSRSERIRINEPPIAQFSITPQNPNPDQDVVFDATLSKDPDGGDLKNYTWDFGDGNRTSGYSVTHKYKKGGPYKVLLTVFDDSNASDESELPLEVNMAPVATFSFDPSEPSVGDVVTFSAGESKDEDGSIVGWRWSFGDGNIAEDLAEVQHVYLKPPSFPIKLIVTDDQGAVGSMTRQIIVKEKQSLPVINSFDLSPSNLAIDPGNTSGKAILTWDTSSADRVTIDNGIGDVGASGSWGVDVQSTTTYTLTAENGAGSVQDSARIDVTQESKNRAPVIWGLTPDLPSPQPVGGNMSCTTPAIIWTVSSSDPDNDRLYYNFFVTGPLSSSVESSIESGWMDTSYFALSTCGAVPGRYRITARVRDGFHAGPDYYDNETDEYYTLSDYVSPTSSYSKPVHSIDMSEGNSTFLPIFLDPAIFSYMDENVTVSH